MGAVHSSEATITSLLPANQDLVHIPCDYTVGQALELLRSTGISWLPVGYNVDDEAKSCSELRTLCYTDLLKSLVESNVDKAIFLASPVVRATSTKHSVLVHSNASLATCLDRMIHDRVYRLAIAEQQVLLHLVPQMDLLQFIYQNRRAFLGDDYLRLTALEIHSLGSSPVVSLAEDQTVAEACSLMMSRNIQAVPVVDRSSKMIGCISPATLLSLVTLDEIHSNRSSINETVLGEVVREQQVLLGSVSIRESLECILQRMIREQQSYVFVVGINDNPLKVVTVSDVIRFVLQGSSP